MSRRRFLRLITLILSVVFMLSGISTFEAYAHSVIPDGTNVLVGNSHYISVTAVQQENGYYCGPACAVMAAQALNLGSYTQSSMASIIGCSSSFGSSMAGIVNGINDLLEDDHSSKKYEYSSIQDVSISDIVDSINNNVPVFVSVKKMPYYSDPVSVGHFVLITGYYYTTGLTRGENEDKVEENLRAYVHFRIIDPYNNSNYFGTHYLTWSELYTASYYYGYNGNVGYKL